MARRRKVIAHFSQQFGELLDHVLYDEHYHVWGR